ncbi:mannose-1-phosphate guanylyltransferase [Mucisphaera calidilacus]|uniref:Mannose-1-phosphate guanylyltransferase n=1 Tax=Mucisphaera calidilacus TaxID=2527982 RepID=A0A518C0C7_9BACT|nr:sugar phosphate nucleotidyltransferase [Mucisphaera calidilacus]QDU72674.1 Mannose-1-phosphate guanylyltransferase [Mucisphaera calidilacus]
MRYALIIAGGSGTRLWPMSTRDLPKQLIPLFGGKSLLELAVERLLGLVGAENLYVCAGSSMRDVMLRTIPSLSADNFIAEPMGRDTLNAIALSCAVLRRQDPDATVGVFTADQLIEPVETFQQIVEQGFSVAEAADDLLVTFGVEPTHPATGYGYLELTDKLPESDAASLVGTFKEKPDLETARTYLAAKDRFLWNSGMFVWKAETLLRAVEQFAPENHGPILELAESWGTEAWEELANTIYPTLKKISIDFAVMEPASRAPDYRVAAIPSPFRWLDVGSWPSYQTTLDPDDANNTSSGCPNTLLDCKNTLVASDDPDHLVAAIGLEDVIIVRTAKATLVCRAQDAERIKQLHAAVGEQHGDAYL